MMIGFAGLLLAGYTEGKQSENAATLENYKKLAGMLITLVLKTDPDNLRIQLQDVSFCGGVGPLGNECRA